MESFRFFVALRLTIFALFLMQFAFTNADLSCQSITRPMLNELCGVNQLEISYGHENLECGEEMPLSSISNRPSPRIKFLSADSEKTYTMMMIDPDAPNSGTNYWLHWLVVNIQGDDLRSGVNPFGKVLTEYNAPTPPAGTGKHRYQFFLLEQSEESFAAGPAQRGQFNAIEFAKTNKNCGPVAATFQFLTENKKKKN